MRHLIATYVRLFLIPICVAVVPTVGCSRTDTPASQEAQQPPETSLKTTPELLKLFGGEANLIEVQNAWSSSTVSFPAVMYAGGRFRRLADMVGTSDSYDFSKPVDGDLGCDLTADFTGPEYWKLKNAGHQVNPVSVDFDMKRRVLEVRVGTEVQGRASFEPMVSRLEDFLKELGYSSKSR